MIDGGGAQVLPPSLQKWMAAIDTDSLGDFQLGFVDDRLFLRRAAAQSTLSVDFEVGSTGFRAQRARSERLVRACAARPGSVIIDATGGLGTDAWLLASAGAEVHVLERHPVLAALLADGLRRARARQADTAGRLHLYHDDSRTRLPRWPQPVSAIYLDPMYPPRRKRALGDGRLRLLAALFAEQGREQGDDVAGLLRAALAAASERVVLKRSRRESLPIGLPEPHYCLDGRSTRFDVWRRATT